VVRPGGVVRSVTSYRYPAAVIRGDYVRAASGLAICAGAIVFAGSGPVILLAFSAMGAVFLIFGLRTWKKSREIVTVDDEGISTSGPGGANLRWREVDKVRLSYYSTRRDQVGGWMQLVLKGAAVRVRVDSSLDGFDAVARLAARAVQRNGLALSTSTASNFLVLGIDLTDSVGG
jgi:hypothetical protein